MISFRQQIVLLCVILFGACKPKYQKPINVKQDDVVGNLFISAHKSMINNEEEAIDSLLNIVNLPFNKDSTGVRIYIDEGYYVDSMGYPNNGDHVLLAYHCVLFEDVNAVTNNILEDTILFKLGYSKQMKGLNHAVKLLKIGDKAKIIIPSYLGFGMSGYKEIVPPYSTLLLNVKLLNIKE